MHVSDGTKVHPNHLSAVIVKQDYFIFINQHINLGGKNFTHIAKEKKII